MGQAQEPFWQVLPPVQVVPQEPQLLLSAFKLTQALLQAVWPVGQEIAHEPTLQIFPPVQVVPHTPQLLGSDCKFTQIPLQAVKPEVQAQTLFWQVLPPVQAVPHVPQLPPSLLKLTQRPLQAVCGGGQDVAQLPFVQIFPAPHELPQEPQ